MPWSANTLPKVVLLGLDRGETKLGRIMMIALGLFALLFGILLLVLPDPEGEAPEVAVWFFGVWAIMFAYSWWLSRKYLRVHRTRVARLLLERPHTIVAVREQTRRAATGGVETVDLPFDGERELQPRQTPGGNMVGIRLNAYSWFLLSVQGKWISRKIVVPTEHAPAVTRWLLEYLADGSPECRWGERTVAEVARSRVDGSAAQAEEPAPR